MTKPLSDRRRFLALLLAVSIRLSLVGAVIASPQNASPAAAPANGEGGPRASETVQELSRTFETLAKRVSPGVVEVIVTRYGTADEDDTRETSPVSRARSVGAGMIVDPEGYILTNYHVVKGADQVRVRITPAATGDSQAYAQLEERVQVFPARVLGFDKQIDLAVLKVEATGLPTLPIGVYTGLRKGQIVLAFGSPQGLENSVSLGLVSSVLRQPDPDSPLFYIQTDAAINSGNSGGPLMDLDGNVVGINTFIYSKSGGNEGIGFAIPSGIARYVYQQVRKYGRVKRRTIGADLRTLTPELAQGLNIRFLHGVIVSDVQPDSTAARAGLEIQDVIVSMDGSPVNSLVLFNVNLHLNETANFTRLGIVRGAKNLELSVPVYEPAHDPEHLSDIADPTKDLIPRLGIVGVTVNSEVEALLGTLRVEGGVAIASLVDDHLAADSGLAVGDVIHTLKGVPITSVANLRDTFDALKRGESTTMQVERAGRLSYVTFEME